MSWTLGLSPFAKLSLGEDYLPGGMTLELVFSSMQRAQARCVSFFIHSFKTSWDGEDSDTGMEKRQQLLPSAILT